MRQRDLYLVLATICLGTFFLVAGLGKLLLGSDNFSVMMPLNFLPPSVAGFVSFIVPFAETTIGALLVLGFAVRFVTAVSAVLVAGFAASNLYMISGGLGAQPCATCFGVFGSLSAYSALWLDGFMALLVIVVLLFTKSNYFDMTPWYLTPVHKPGGVPSLGVPHRCERYANLKKEGLKNAKVANLV